MSERPFVYPCVRVVVFYLEGPPGVGKTTLWQSLPDDIGICIGEEFMNYTPPFGFHCQSPASQLKWILSRFERVTDAVRRHWNPNSEPADENTTSLGVFDPRSDRVVYIIMDRSPYSGVVFARCQTDEERDVLRSVVDLMTHEHRKLGIESRTILLKRDTEVIWADIVARLVEEPERLEYNEGSREHFDDIIKRYEDEPVFHGPLAETIKPNMQDLVDLIHYIQDCREHGICDGEDLIHDGSWDIDELTASCRERAHRADK